MWRILIAAFCLPAAAQVSDLAVSDDGQTLLFRSNFRLQGETDVANQGKIYRYQNGQWTRLAAAPEQWGLVPPDVLQPFLTSDPQIFGWHTYSGCGACQLVIIPPGSAVIGTALPSDFPRSNLLVSRNARYFIGDRVPFPGVKYLDLGTGATADVPVPSYSLPIRDIANDGSALILITAADDPGMDKTPGTVSVWRPGSDPRAMYSGFVSRAVFSAIGRMIAVESASNPGANVASRNLLAVDAQTDEQIPIGPLPSGINSRISLSQAAWDTSGTNLIYRGFDDRGQPSSVMLWSALTRASTTLFTSVEMISNIAISGDGTVIWAVTGNNRLLRIDALSGTPTEILPALPSITNVEGQGVPGSAVFLQGSGFAKQQQAVDSGLPLPQIDTAPDSYSLQIPWEYRGQPAAAHDIGVRAGGNPFEAVAKVYVVDAFTPQFAYVQDTRPGNLNIKAVHDDFSALVSSDNPARPGETLHVYMTGLGPLDQAVATGAPGPSSPPARPLAGMNCRTGTFRPIDVPFVAYAAGLVGVYQVDITMPDSVGDGPTYINCGNDITRGFGQIPTTSSR
jgi:uncharacterized protein (TIGR03437 family)